MDRNWLAIICAIAISLVIYFADFGLAQNAQAALAIVLLIGILWFTEAFPLWVTALMVPVLLVLFASQTPKDVFTPFFDPIIALLFGGFILAQAVKKHGLDVRIAAFFVGLFGTKPCFYLLGLMAATAFLSFWISNTAAALLMIPIGLAAIKASNLQKLKSNYSKTVILGIGYAATAGGVGTLIGTPPNLITAKLLGAAGTQMNFFDWTAHALPLVVFVLLITWVLLILLNKPEINRIKAPQIKQKTLNKNQKTTIGVFALTAFLWLTESLHGIHYSIIAMFPVFALYLAKTLDEKDLPKIGWSALILVGGSLALGAGIQNTGLDRIIAEKLSGIVMGYPTFLVFLLISWFSIAFTAFVANTAGAAILVPVMIPLAGILGVSPKALALLIGMTVSFDFVVPAGTPPNAIAYETGYIRVKDMVKSGLVISIIAGFIAACFAMFW